MYAQGTAPPTPAALFPSRPCGFLFFDPTGSALKNTTAAQKKNPTAGIAACMGWCVWYMAWGNQYPGLHLKLEGRQIGVGLALGAGVP